MEGGSVSTSVGAVAATTKKGQKGTTWPSAPPPTSATILGEPKEKAPKAGRKALEIFAAEHGVNGAQAAADFKAAGETVKKQYALMAKVEGEEFVQAYAEWEKRNFSPAEIADRNTKKAAALAAETEKKKKAAAEKKRKRDEEAAAAAALAAAGGDDDDNDEEEGGEGGEEKMEIVVPPKIAKAPKTPKAPKEPKAPKAPKEPKPPKEPKAPKEPKEPKVPKPKAPRTLMTPEETESLVKKIVGRMDSYFDSIVVRVVGDLHKGISSPPPPAKRSKTSAASVPVLVDDEAEEGEEEESVASSSEEEEALAEEEEESDSDEDDDGGSLASAPGPMGVKNGVPTKFAAIEKMKAAEAAASKKTKTAKA